MYDRGKGIQPKKSNTDKIKYVVTKIVSFSVANLAAPM